ncbi:MAG TPA: dipeptidase PepE [Thermoanaerobaculia bacterium]|nr:dipeptidase PepE [Thermoanaerobaculia bacterium]
MSQLLLLSNSGVHGEEYLAWAEEAIAELLEGMRTVAFVPYALHDLDAYTATARRKFESMGFELRAVHEAETPAAGVREADAVFVGGGNTFRLLTRLHQTGLIDAIRKRVREGMRYIGSSAGTNVACPTIKTTNDMPIVHPPTFEALGLVRFQINPHYLDPDPASKHMGETREQRIREFHEMNDAPVVALREAAFLRVDGDSVRLGGRTGARLFRRGADPTEHLPGEMLEL